MALDQQALEAAREVYEQAFPGAYVTFDGMEAAITAYLAALGDGWRLVPVELPDEMMIATLRAGYAAKGATEAEADALIARWARDPERREFSRAQYAAMLAAAPTPPGEKK